MTDRTLKMAQRAEHHAVLTPTISRPDGGPGDRASLRFVSYRRWPLAILAIAQCLVLHVAFAHVLSPIFYYLGERYRTPDITSYIFTLLAVAIAALTLPRRDEAQNVAGVTAILFAVMFVPLMFVPQISDLATQEQADALSLGAFLSGVVVNRALARPPSTWLPLVKIDFRLAAVLVTGLTLALDAYIAQRGGVQNFSTDISRAYEIRDAYRTSVGSDAGLGYAVRAVGNVLGPLLITLGLFRHRLATGLLGVASQLIVYSATGYKMALLSTVFIAVVWALNHLRRFTPGGALAAFVGLSGVATAHDMLRGGTNLSAIFVDRISIMSGLIPSAYISFFSQAPKALWSDSVLSGLVADRYDTSIIFIIGNRLTGNPEVAANSNFLADGYANAGVPGVILELAVLILLLRVTLSAARGLSTGVTSCLLLTPMFSLANSSPITAILSSGFALLVPILMTFPREGDLRDSDEGA